LFHASEDSSFTIDSDIEILLVEKDFGAPMELSIGLMMNDLN